LCQHRLQLSNQKEKLRAVQLKVVAFKTSQLKAAKEFIVIKLGFSLKEYSPPHFVIHSNGARPCSIESNDIPDLELYIRCHPSIREQFRFLRVKVQNSVIIFVSKNK
jgi:hypothetical protein